MNNVKYVQDIRNMLYERKDEKYADFQENLTPGLGREKFIGVRTPELRKLAKELAKKEDINIFLETLPHEYFDENQLHGFIVSLDKDFDRCMERVEAFLPYVDNWATCDQLSPAVFKKHKEELLEYIKRWIISDKTYTIRFAIEMLMRHFLDDDFDSIYLRMVAQVKSDEYYVNMMIAWYFATALAKQYDATIAYIEKKELAVWTHNKTIQKAVESFRVSDERKAYLKTLKIK